MACKSILTIVRDALPLFSCNFLQELNEKLSSDDHAIVRATPTNKEEVKQWLEEFARVAGICYVIDKEHKAARKAYRIDFICQHSDRNKSVKSDSRRLIEHQHKATGCKQRLYVSVQRVTPSVLRTEKKKGESYVKQGLVATFSFTGVHNHQVLTADSGRFLRASTAVKNDITDKFKEGQAPSTVARQLKDECLEPQATASASNCPTNRQIYYLWDKFQQSEYGGRSNEDIFSLLESRIPEYLQDGIQIKFSREPFAIAIVTPLMRRTGEFYTGEILFVDSTSSCDVTNTVLTFLLIPTPAGGSPIGAVLTQSQSSKAYEAGFSMLKEMFGSTAFHPFGYPTVTMTDDSAAERDAIFRIWPNTVLLLCQFHVSQAVWRWILQGNKLAVSDRQEVLSHFRGVMYAESEEEANDQYEKLCALLADNNYTSCLKYFSSWWNRRVEWCCAYRKMPALRGHNTNNYAEANIRVFKDIGVNRVKQYNSVSLMHAVITTMEDFYRNRFLEFAHNRMRLNIYKLRHLLKEADFLSSASIIKVSDNVYNVPSKEDPTRHYEVNAVKGSCSCHIGNNGTFCKHQCGVAYYMGVNMPNAPQTSDNDRYNAAKVALGDYCQDRQFFLSLRSDNTSTPALDPTTNTLANGQEVNVSNIIEPNPEVFCTKDTVLDTWREISAQFENKLGVLNDANWAELKNSLDVFGQRLHNCNNDSQFNTFFRTTGGGIARLKRAGTMIGVQPTSKSRRASNRSRGNRTLSHGRNAKAVELLNKAKKRKVAHSLSQNVKKNIANYRKH